eukprot:s51_g22.t1
MYTLQEQLSAAMSADAEMPPPACEPDADPSPEPFEDPYQFFESWEAGRVLLAPVPSKSLQKNSENAQNLDPSALSQNEIKKIRRLMAAREDGTFLVPESVVKLWGDTTDGGREEDAFIKKCKRKVESIQERDLWVDGEFMSEKAMVDDGIPAKRILAIKATCAKRVGKKQRSSLIDEEDADMDDFDNSWNDLLPAEMTLPEDTTDPTEIAEAASVDCQKNNLKALMFPTMDDADALPSTISKRAIELDNGLSGLMEKITEVNTVGIVNGYRREHQDELDLQYKEARKQCAEALNLVTRSQPFINSLKQKKLKEIRDREKAEERFTTPSRAKPVKSESRRRSIPTSAHTHIEGPETAVLHYLRPRDVLKTLLAQDPWLLLGGLDPGPPAYEMLKAFWDTYRLEHPSHKVFQMERENILNLENTIPMMLHGDGGRTAKKQPLEVVSLVAVLGLDTYKGLTCGCENSVDFTTNRATRDPLLQKLNSKNNSYLSHFLLFAFPSKKFKKTPGLLKAMLQRVSEDMASCCTDGVTVRDQRWNFAVVGLRGDAEWHSKTGQAGAFFRYDPFHVFRLGIARNFIGSCLIFLCNEGYYDTPGDSVAVVERLGRAWSSFSLWCEANSQSPQSMRSFSKEKLHYATTTSFPFVGCKGSDTILLLKYLQWFAGLQLNVGPRTELLRLIKLGCDRGLGLQAIHRHALWLPRGCRSQIYEMAKGFNRNFTLFGMVPKAHALGHIYHDLERTRQNACSINPALWDTSSSEDFVGRVARQSRRIGYRNIVSNTLLAYKVKCKFVIQRFKKQRRQ